TPRRPRPSAGSAAARGVDRAAEGDVSAARRGAPGARAQERSRRTRPALRRWLRRDLARPVRAPSTHLRSAGSGLLLAPREHHPHRAPRGPWPERHRMYVLFILVLIAAGATLLARGLMARRRPLVAAGALLLVGTPALLGV